MPDICRELGVSRATFNKWRAKCSGMGLSMISRMKELEEENRRLKKMHMEEKLKAEIVTEALKKMAEAISQTGDDLQSSEQALCMHKGGLPGG